MSGKKADGAFESGGRMSFTRMGLPLRILLILEILVSLGAIVSGAIMMAFPVDTPFGFGELLPYMTRFPGQELFFQSLFWSGFALCMIVGIPHALAAVFCFKGRIMRFCMFSTIAGGLLVLWCVYEYIFLPNPLAILYWVIGLIEFIGSLILAGRYRLNE